MKIPEHIVEQVKANADVVEVIGAHVQLVHKGRNYVGLCPFHKERTPSFNVNRERGLYKCFGCGRSGDAITFVRDYLHMDFVEAVRHLAAQLHIVIPEEETEDPTGEHARRDAARKALVEAVEYYRTVLSTSDGTPARAFFAQRGFGADIIERFALGAAPAGWDHLLNHLVERGFTQEHLDDAGLIIRKDDGKAYDRFRGRAMFPIRDHQGRPVGFSARMISQEPDAPKYVNSPQSVVFDKSRVLYGLDLARRTIAERKEAMLVEGQADVISLHQAGFTQAIATSGTALTPEHLALIKRFAHTIVLVFDADAAGQKAMTKAIELGLASGVDVRCVELPPGEDPDSLIRSQGAQAMQQALESAMPWMQYQTERFRRAGFLTDPVRQSSAVREMLRWITSVPDKIQHPFLIRELAKRFDIAESLLLSETSTVHPQRRQQPTSQSAPTAQHSAALKPKPPAILAAERTLLSVALTVEHGLTDLLNVFELDPDELVTALARSVYSRILVAAEEHHDVAAYLLNSAELEQHERAIVEDVLRAATEPSARWKTFDVELPELETQRLIKDAICQLRAYRIQMEIEHRRQELERTTDAEAQRVLQHHIFELVLKRQNLLKLAEEPVR